MFSLHQGNCLDILRTMPDDSVDSIVTDPPYGLSFMSKKWDYDVPSTEIWVECFRVLKPGGHLLAFAGTRTQHRMAVRIEDAGFEIRDMIAWVYGSGFPKSMDVSKAIDKASGIWRGKSEGVKSTNSSMDNPNYIRCDKGTPATDEAKKWAGWGTALKPALEPITVARKPFKGTVAQNVQTHGTGALNIDGCRVETDESWEASEIKSSASQFLVSKKPIFCPSHPGGRWAANFIHDGSDEVLDIFPQTQPATQKTSKRFISWDKPWTGTDDSIPRGHVDDGGSAARFFYCAKACKADRGEDNNHPTVKPTDLMRYLCRLVTPPGGTVLDPFTGSGSTGRGAILEGFKFIGCELDPDYIAIARQRICAAVNEMQPCLTFD